MIPFQTTHQLIQGKENEKKHLATDGFSDSF
jgi:hypothetical protein